MQFLDPRLREQVERRDQGRCSVCGFSVPGALVIHHRVPHEFGGLDTLANLKLLCSRCHDLVHGFGADIGRFERDQAKLATSGLPKEAIERLRLLAGFIVRSRLKARTSGLEPHKLVSLDTAAGRVAQRNYFSAEQAKRLKTVLTTVVKAVPRRVGAGVSYRLVGRERFISIMSWNTILLRTPAYSDRGVRRFTDAFIIMPSAVKHVAGRPAKAFPTAYEFARFRCRLLALEYEHLLAFAADDWAEFKMACVRAHSARQGGRGVSNIEV